MVVLLALLAIVQLYPDLLFAHARTYRGFTIRSDRPIDPAITHVIDDTRRRLATDPAAPRDDRFRVFLCNSAWRLRLFTGQAALGGGTAYATRNIFIRAADIAANVVRPPNGKAILDQRDRPLSYFIAHEATHVRELRRYGVIAMLRTPSWLAEGYADKIAKAGDFDLAENRMLLRRGNLLLTDDMARKGLYRRYHLLVETALTEPGATIDTLFTDPPPEDRILAEAIG